MMANSKDERDGRRTEGKKGKMILAHKLTQGMVRKKME